MSIKIPIALGTLCLVFMLTGCRSDTDGPPTIRYGDSVCDECGMIISDERFATTTVIQGDRGPEPMLFDDFSCQLNYENSHSDLNILTRWSHDHNSSQWLSTNDAFFVRSDQLQTPMASHIAAFGSSAEADAFAKSLNDESVERLEFKSLYTDK